MSQFGSSLQVSGGGRRGHDHQMFGTDHQPAPVSARLVERLVLEISCEKTAVQHQFQRTREERGAAHAPIGQQRKTEITILDVGPCADWVVVSRHRWVKKDRSFTHTGHERMESEKKRKKKKKKTQRGRKAKRKKRRRRG